MFQFFYRPYGSGISGTGAGTFGDLTGLSYGGGLQSGTSAGTLPALTGLSSGEGVQVGTGNGLLPRLTGAAAGYATDVGVSSGTFGPIFGLSWTPGVTTISSAGTLPVMRGQSYGRTYPYAAYFTTPLTSDSILEFRCGSVEPTLSSPSVYWLYMGTAGTYQFEYQPDLGVIFKPTGLAFGLNIYTLAVGSYRVTVLATPQAGVYSIAIASLSGPVCP